MTASPNSSLLDKHASLAEAHTHNRMRLDLQHYNDILPSQVAERDLMLIELEKTCSRSRFLVLKHHLDGKYDEEILFSQRAKTKKINKLLKKPKAPDTNLLNWWIPSLHL